jgi:uncharacterized protein YeaO (DUF488 family)
MIQIKRIYEEPTEDDGIRILVDRLWPRGVSKEAAQLDEWMKDIAPSDALRKEFHHDPERWEDFKEKYFEELADKPEPVERLRRLVEEEDKVTLLYAAKDEAHNNARALKAFLDG